MKLFLDGRVTLHVGDCMAVLPTLPECSVDSVVTDPPYHLTSIAVAWDTMPAKRGKPNITKKSVGFMGQSWDGGDIAFRPETWAAVLRVLKPGGHMVAFAAPKNGHRMVCAIEDAGFEIRDQLMWLFGSGFPKGLDVSKAIDKAAGAEREVVGVNQDWVRRKPNGSASENSVGFSKETDYNIYAPATDASRQWEGWNVALKPAYEPICLARKPLSEPTIAANVLKHGTGALNIAACRIGTDVITTQAKSASASPQSNLGKTGFRGVDASEHTGRWPANVIHDGSEEVVAAFPETGVSNGGGMKDLRKGKLFLGDTNPNVTDSGGFGDSGSAARFFYTAKADADDRLGSKHPTVKPLDLIQYLCRLITPPKGVVLDCFAGTGTTGEAAWREGFSAILIEREPEYLADIERRMQLCLSGPDERARESIKARQNGKPMDHGPLFGGACAF